MTLESCLHFFPNKLFSQLLDISPTNQIYTETFCSEFLNLVPLDIKDRIHLTLVANDIVYNEIFNWAQRLNLRQRLCIFIFYKKYGQQVCTKVCWTHKNVGNWCLLNFLKEDYMKNNRINRRSGGLWNNKWLKKRMQKKLQRPFQRVLFRIQNNLRKNKTQQRRVRKHTCHQKSSNKLLIYFNYYNYKYTE